MCPNVWGIRNGVTIFLSISISIYISHPMSGRPTLLRHYQKQCCFRNERNKINSRTRSANMTADHYLVLSAPSTAESRAVDSKQSARTKPKGFALTALCDCRAFRTKTMEDSRLCQYLAEHGDISRKPLCHLYTYNRRSGSLKAHSNVILATTVSDLCAKTSQWSTQSYQKCSDAGFLTDFPASRK